MKNKMLVMVSVLMMLTIIGYTQSFNDGLVAHYPFNGNANDASGNGNDGIYSKYTLPTSDRFGVTNSAFAFNGVYGKYASYIAISNTVFNLGQDEYTISLWFKPNDINPSGDLFSGLNTAIGLTVGFHSMPGCIDFSLGTGNVWWTTLYRYGPRIQYDTNKWYHYVLTKHWTTYTSYINGKMQYTCDITEANGYDFDFKLLIGAYDTNGAEAYKGSIDDILIYNRTLNTQEILGLYADSNVIVPEPKSEISINVNTVQIITVKSIQVVMKVTPKKVYQLQSSTDLKVWSNMGYAFQAIGNQVTQQYNISGEAYRFYRLRETP